MLRLRRLRRTRSRCRTKAAGKTQVSESAAGEGGGCVPGEWRDELGDGGCGRCCLRMCRCRRPVPPVQAKEKGAVVVNAGLQVPVPSFEGAALRSVVERADSVGLRVQAVGSGLAREQVPAAGTMVPAGTEVVVRFTR